MAPSGLSSLVTMKVIFQGCFRTVVSEFCWVFHVNAFPALLALFDTRVWQSNSTFVELSHKLRQRQMLKKIQTDLPIGVMGRASYRAVDKNRVSIVAFSCLLLSVQFSIKNTCYRIYSLKVCKCLKVIDTIYIKMHNSRLRR